VGKKSDYSNSEEDESKLLLPLEQGHHKTDQSPAYGQDTQKVKSLFALSRL